MTVRISGVRFVPAPMDLQATGLVGWSSFLVNDALRLDGVGVRRAADGRHVLAYPVREDASGREHYAVRPIDSRTRRLIEARVLGELGFPIEEAR